MRMRIIPIHGLHDVMTSNLDIDALVRGVDSLD